MPQTGHDRRLPPALNIIALATFAANLSTRALDPVLPHVAEDFSVTIATAAGFSAVYAFTFAVVQPVVGAAADLFGKARLMVLCLALLGLANVLGAFATSFLLLFASRILAGVAAGGVADGTLLAVPGTPAGTSPVEFSSECSWVRAVGVLGS